MAARLTVRDSWYLGCKCCKNRLPFLPICASWSCSRSTLISATDRFLGERYCQLLLQSSNLLIFPPPIPLAECGQRGLFFFPQQRKQSGDKAINPLYGSDISACLAAETLLLSQQVGQTWQPPTNTVESPRNTSSGVKRKSDPPSVSASLPSISCL